MRRTEEQAKDVSGNNGEDMTTRLLKVSTNDEKVSTP